MNRPIVIGLTGSIGMGKSTTAAMFADSGCAVWDADAAVHRLYAKGGAGVAAIAGLRPEAIVEGAVSREELKAWIAEDPAALRKIEEVIHPLVADDRKRFLAATEADVAVLDIPLLFEGDMSSDFDMTVVVSAPAEVQRARVLARPGMTEARFEALLAKQIPDAEKRKRADRVIETIDPDSTREAVAAILAQIGERHA
ncbi:MAG: dephospho-CoA kinase [Rhodobacteraceae bacterium]|nr:dephospho-CoA kinase [Paracoccaceae bacterium]